MLRKTSDLIGDWNASDDRRDWLELFVYANVHLKQGSAAQKKLLGAIRLLLRIAELTAEGAELDLLWFDAMFPRTPKFPLSVTIEIYADARHRVRPAVRRLTGKDRKPATDNWNSLCDDLYKRLGGKRAADLKLIPLRSTLSHAARARGIQPTGLTQDLLMDFHEAAKGSAERSSIRAASRLLSEAQERFPAIAAKLPHPIEPICADAATRYFVPVQFEREIDELEENAARKKSIEITDEYEMVADGTRIGMRTSLRALVDGLIRTGHLDPKANSFLPLLDDEEALKVAAKGLVERVRRGEIVSRHAATLVRRIPVALDRNGISSTEFRRQIADVAEFKAPRDGYEMLRTTKRFCRALIEDVGHRQRFLCAHNILQEKANGILALAHQRGKPLTPLQKRQVIHLGTVALFCAIETGGAPVRVSNVLEMPYGGPDAWLRPIKDGFRVEIPGSHVKNKKKIEFNIQHGPQAYAETVAWYLRKVRPLILEGAKDKRSNWLVPMLSDPRRPCCYEAFLNWFERLMAKEVELPCTPHNFRHGQASLLYHEHPEHLKVIAERLGDKSETVTTFYAWVHKELAMAEGQRLLTGLLEETV